MELRSGAVTGLDGVASMATQESRAAAAAAKAAKATAGAGKVDPRWCLIPQAGESHGDLEPGPHFEKGVDAIFTKWTALQLAIDMGWGGQDSEEKGRLLRDEVLDWFYNGKGALYADELEDLLMDAMRTDFNTECEDQSPREVSVRLVNLYTDIARGNFAAVEHLIQAAHKSHGKTRSVKAKRQRGADGASVSRQTVEGEEEDSSSSSSEDDDEEDEQEPMLVAPKPKPEKVIDEDGFELVQKGRRKR